jgi:hypothetical protein
MQASPYVFVLDYTIAKDVDVCSSRGDSTCDLSIIELDAGS